MRVLLIFVLMFLLFGLWFHYHIAFEYCVGAGYTERYCEINIL
jgi:hypothetical protein